MDVFFLISGFLITLVLHKNIARTGTLQLARFWKRRLLRLYPALLAMVTVYSAIAWFLLEDAHPAFQDALYSLLYVSNFVKLYDYNYPTLFGHTWSLSIEEQFYVMWPLLFVAALNCRFYWKGMLVLLAPVMVGAIAWRLHLVEAGVPWSRIYYSLETRMDAFIIGGMTAYVWLGWSPKWAGRDLVHYALCGCALGLAGMFAVARPLAMEYFV